MGLHIFSSGLALAAVCIASINASSASGSQFTNKRALPSASNLPGNWTYSGCYTEIAGGRTLPKDSHVDTQNMTAAACISYCSAKGWIYAGTEYSNQCWCGLGIDTGSTKLDTSNCSMACAGDSTQQCGGENKLSIYWNGLSGPQTNPGTTPWSFVTCFTEGINGQRTLPNSPDIMSDMTTNICTNACQTAGYTLAGTEYADQCFCGNATTNAGSPATTQFDCNMPCKGNASEWCGGPNRLNLYQYNNSYDNNLLASSTAPPRPSPTGPSNKAMISNYRYYGCQTEANNTRALTPGAQANDQMTLEICQTYCAGYTYFGTEYGRECYCGNSLSTGSVAAPESDCTATCYGNTYEFCGNGNRLSVYLKIA